MKKGLIDPYTGHVWVRTGLPKKWWVRKVFRHGGTLCMRIPAELAKELNLEHDGFVMLKREPAGIVFSVVTVAKSSDPKEG